MTGPLGLAGKKALVGGGGRGIGESTALRLAEAGCDVALADLDEGRAEAVAKAGLIHLVRINAVAPGMTVTPRTAARMNAEASRAEAAKIPLGTPDDVGKVIQFFASDLAGHVTGTTLAIDGGPLAAPNHDLGPSRAASARNRRSLGIDLDPLDRNDT